MDFIITDDGSLTFRKAELDELYHTEAGAIVEALEKHARALKVWEMDYRMSDSMSRMVQFLEEEARL